MTCLTRVSVFFHKGVEMIGEALRLIRVLNDKKLIDVSNDLNISSGYLSELEKDKKKPSLDTIEKLASYYECKPSAILLFSEKLEDDSLKSKIKTSIQKKLLAFMEIVEQGKNV